METQINRFLQKNIEKLQSIYIFGSFASESQNDASDIDIAILAEQKQDTVSLYNLAQELATYLDRSIDLIDLRAASTVFAYEIVGTGKRIFNKNKDAVDQYENYIFSSYLSFNDGRSEILEQIKADKAVL
jgi:predicted nucleotidyltransferase